MGKWGDVVKKIIVIDKPKGVTSFDVVRDCKRKYNTRKVGHCGTLDPMATGVLVIAMDSGTKLIQFMDKVDKEYIATATIGKKYDTGDITGEVIEESNNEITEYSLRAAFKKFTGKIMQVPPMYSAIKIDGKKLYQYARAGIEIEVPAREVEVKEIELLSLADDKFTFKVVVSKGTYIRTLIEDIAQECGTVASMSDLRRTKSGLFTLDKLEYDFAEALSIPIIEVSDEDVVQLRHGRKLPTKEIGRFQLQNNGNLISIVDCNGEMTKMVRLIAEAF